MLQNVDEYIWTCTYMPGEDLLLCSPNPKKLSFQPTNYGVTLEEAAEKGIRVSLCYCLRCHFWRYLNIKDRKDNCDEVMVMIINFDDQ